jgi:hypothetical protein
VVPKVVGGKFGQFAAADRQQPRTYRLLRNSLPTGRGLLLVRLANHAPYRTAQQKNCLVIPVCAARPIRRDSYPPCPVLLHRKGSVMKRKLLLALVLIGVLSVVLVGRAGAATKSTSPVATFAGAVTGSSTLVRTDSGIAFSLETSGLPAGHAVTIWWMVLNPDGRVSVQYAAGHVIDQGGAAEFGGALQEGNTSGVINNGPGLLDAAGANIVLVVRDHGPARPDIVEEQIHTFGACNPTCADLQISMHAAG